MASGLLKRVGMSLRLLIVDDEVPLSWAMEKFFASNGYQVDCTPELRTAFNLLEVKPYDVAITDLRLSGTMLEEGLLLSDYIRLHAPRVKTVLLTAYASPELEARALRRGVSMVLSKPRPLPDLARHLSALVER